MIKVTVMHKHREIIDGLDVVADVHAPTHNVMEALEYAYKWTQNMSGSWSKKIGSDSNDNVEVLETRKDGLGLRSTMVGDRMMIDCSLGFNTGAEFEVSSFGFEEVNMDIN